MYRFDELGSVQLERVRAAAGGALVPDELARMLDARPDLRLRIPSVLGVRDLDDLIGADVRARSSADLDVAARLVRVFASRPRSTTRSGGRRARWRRRCGRCHPSTARSSSRSSTRRPAPCRSASWRWRVGGTARRGSRGRRASSSTG